MGRPVVEFSSRVPGRLRLRLWWLRAHRERVEPLAQVVAALDGVERVEVRRFTGSVLVEYDAARIDEEHVARAVAEAVGGQVVRPGEEMAVEQDQLALDAYREGAELTRAATAFVKGLDARVLHWTEGGADAGTVVALALLAGGAAEVIATGQLPVPPWFQLAWWAFRTFATLEERTIDATAHPLEVTLH